MFGRLLNTPVILEGKGNNIQDVKIYKLHFLKKTHWFKSRPEVSLLINMYDMFSFKI